MDAASALRYSPGFSASLAFGHTESSKQIDQMGSSLIVSVILSTIKNAFKKREYR